MRDVHSAFKQVRFPNPLAFGLTKVRRGPCVILASGHSQNHPGGGPPKDHDHHKRYLTEGIKLYQHYVIFVVFSF